MDNLATLKHLNSVFEIIEGNEYLLSPFITSKSIVKKLIKQKRILIYKGTKTVYGFIYFRHRKDKVSVIYDVAVLPKVQGRSVGHALLLDFCRLCQKIGQKVIQLKCSVRNTVAYRFYRKHGFEIVNMEKRWNKAKKRNSEYFILRKSLGK